MLTPSRIRHSAFSAFSIRHLALTPFTGAGAPFAGGSLDRRGSGRYTAPLTRMRHGLSARRAVWPRLAAVLLVAGLIAACDANGRRDRSRRASDAREAESSAPYQAEVEEGLGAAVAILVDTSGSMKDHAPGDSRPKYLVARESLEAMLDATDAFVAKRPDFPIKIGLYSFSSAVRTLRAIQPYDRDAMREARPDLYRAGVFRKYLLVVTDGENTRGRNPEGVARDIWDRSGHAVQVYFVAFDTGTDKFAFLKEVGGDVIGAGSGPELRTALDGIYQGKILAEATGAEREPARK